MHQALARRVVGVGVVGGLLASAGMGGCVYDPPIKGQREASAAAQGGGKVSIESPFAPVSLRVHPLTHVDAARGGGDGGGAATCLLVLHLETKDAYGDAVKGVGSLRVELAGGGGESVAWDVSEMLDPEANSARFDVATRTYRLPLKAPAWVAAWAREGGGSGTLELRVMMTTGTGDAGRRVLRDTFTLAR